MCTCDDEVCSVGLSRERVVPRVQKLRRHGLARRRGEILCIVRVGRGSVSTVNVGNTSAFYKSRIKKCASHSERQ
jgi:DNA-binding Lrp family transcriptional regulator